MMPPKMRHENGGWSAVIQDEGFQTLFAILNPLFLPLVTYSNALKESIAYIQVAY